MFSDTVISPRLVYVAGAVCAAWLIADFLADVRASRRALEGIEASLWSLSVAEEKRVELELEAAAAADATKEGK